MEQENRLNEYDKDEWREVYRILKPQATEDQFNKDWAEFQETKRKKQLQ